MKRGEEGYILASAIGVLLAISIVATALVAASADALSRIRRTEIEAQKDSVLQSALALVSAQLLLDPRRRQVLLDNTPDVDVLGARVSLTIGWESSKLDVNLAEPDAIASMLADQRVAQPIRDLVLKAIRGSRLRNAPIRLISDLGVNSTVENCLSSILTVFSGRPDYDRQSFGEKSPVGRPAPGSRLSVDLALPNESRGLAAVVLVTGDPLLPVRLLDWRETNGFGTGDCNEA